MVRMSEFDRSNLLKFLHKPRCLPEIVRHFEVPAKLVGYHLEEAIKFGEVLVLKKQIPQEFVIPNTKKIGSKGVLYISRNSPILAKDVVATNARPKTRGSAISSRKPSFMNAHPKPEKTGLSEIVHNFLTKMKLAKSNGSNRRLRLRGHYVSPEPKSLLHSEKIRLFKMLSNGPLPFLDIHRHFGVSKQIVEGFAKKGFFEEVWGPKNIGVKFKLTKKGKAHLKTLEKASHFEPQQRKKIFIRLKQRIFP